MAKVINCITTRTDAEWPADHPLRNYAEHVMSNQDMARFDPAEVALVCGKLGEERLPCPPDDHDMDTSCFKCGCALVRRASASPAWQSVCFECWEGLQQ